MIVPGDFVKTSGQLLTTAPLYRDINMPWGFLEHRVGNADPGQSALVIAVVHLGDEDAVLVTYNCRLFWTRLRWWTPEFGDE